MGVAALLMLAVIAGALAFDQRGNARDEALAADAHRLGARALLENDLDTSLLLARQGVALKDSLQTRGDLLAALGKSPAAIGVMRGDGERIWELALSPDEQTLAGATRPATSSCSTPGRTSASPPSSRGTATHGSPS